MFIQTLYHSSHCKFGAFQKQEPAGHIEGVNGVNRLATKGEKYY